MRIAAVGRRWQRAGQHHGSRHWLIAGWCCVAASAPPAFFKPPPCPLTWRRFTPWSAAAATTLGASPTCTRQRHSSGRKLSAAALAGSGPGLQACAWHAGLLTTSACVQTSQSSKWQHTVILTVSKKAAALTPRPSFLAPAGHKRPTKQPAFTPCFVDSDSGCWPSSCRQCHTQQLVAAVRPPRCARQAQHRAIA